MILPAQMEALIDEVRAQYPQLTIEQRNTGVPRTPNEQYQVVLSVHVNRTLHLDPLWSEVSVARHFLRQQAAEMLIQLTPRSADAAPRPMVPAHTEDFLRWTTVIDTGIRTRGVGSAELPAAVKAVEPATLWELLENES